MRTPNKEYQIQHRGVTVTIREWIDPTDLPWDGDCELEEGAEGWDLAAEAIIFIDEHYFTGNDSLGSNWGDGSYIKNQMKDVVANALEDLWDRISFVAKGGDLKKEKARQQIAKQLAST